MKTLFPGKATAASNSSDELVATGTTRRLSPPRQRGWARAAEAALKEDTPGTIST